MSNHSKIVARGAAALAVTVCVRVAAADETFELRSGVRTHVLAGRRIHVLVDGALVNIAGLDGNPIEIMDLSFSVQALSIHRLASGGAPVGVNAFPAELDELIAETKLRTLGIELDRPTAAQKAFRGSWSGI